MEKAGSFYQRVCDDEIHSGFWPDIPSILTHLWSKLGVDSAHAEKYEEFKKLDRLSKATELTCLLDKVAEKEKLEQKMIDEKAKELQKLL